VSDIYQPQDDEQPTLTLSFFDTFLGPRALISIPWQKSIPTMIPQFFDIHQPGDFFTYIYQKAVTFNRVFGVPREGERGGEVTFMMTALIPFSILIKNEIFLRYYPSFALLFDAWVDNFKEKYVRDQYNKLIVHGVRQWDTEKIKPVIATLQDYQSELEYVMQTFQKSWR
jgi:hypothetical protein